MFTRTRMITVLLGAAVFGVLMALRGQASSPTARNALAALAFVCFGVLLAWSARKSGSVPP